MLGGGSDRTKVGWSIFYGSCWLVPLLSDDDDLDGGDDVNEFDRELGMVEEWN